MPQFIPEATIDYHLFGPLTEYDIELRLCEFLEDAYIRQYRYVLVITGKGRVVRPLVPKLLRKNKYVKSFQTAGYYNGQEGAIEVELVSSI